MPSPDQPINDKADDKLGRQRLAEKIAEMVTAFKEKESYVIGIEGPWGSGKTSLINLVENQLGDTVQVIKFNPWFFGDEVALIRNFFEEFGDAAATLGLTRAQNRKLARYGQKFSGAQISVAGFGFAVPALSDASMSKLREEIEEDMESAPKKILVVVDDIDRLKADEVRAVFKLVKLMANFPNTIFLLSYDRVRVEKQLSDDDFAGSEYLKKIIQVPLVLPDPNQQDINDLLGQQLDVVIEDMYGPSPSFDNKRWTNLWFSGFHELFKNIRDINTFMNSLRPNWSLVGIDDVNIIDFIGIHAIRVFAPGFYRELAANKSFFTGRENAFATASDKNAKEREEIYQEMLKTVEDKKLRILIDKICRELFPRLDNHGFGADYDEAWRKEKLVTSEEKFDFYFELAVPRGAVSDAEMKKLLTGPVDVASIRTVLLQFDKEKRLKRVLRRITDFLDGLDRERVINLTLAVWSLEGEIKIQREGMFDINDFETIATRIAYQAITKNISLAERPAVLKELFEKTNNVNQAAVMTYLVEHEFDKQGRTPLLANKDDLASFQEVVSGKIAKAVQTKTIYDIPRSAFVLYRWKEWGAPGDVKSYLEEVPKTLSGVADFLRLFVSLVYSTAGDYKKISKKDVEEFIPPLELLNVINSASEDAIKSLSSEQQEAIVLFTKPPRGDGFDD